MQYNNSCILILWSIHEASIRLEEMNCMNGDKTRKALNRGCPDQFRITFNKNAFPIVVYYDLPDTTSCEIYLFIVWDCASRGCCCWFILRPWTLTSELWTLRPWTLTCDTDCWTRLGHAHWTSVTHIQAVGHLSRKLSFYRTGIQTNRPTQPSACTT